KPPKPIPSIPPIVKPSSSQTRCPQSTASRPQPFSRKRSAPSPPPRISCHTHQLFSLRRSSHSFQFGSLKSTYFSEPRNGIHFMTCSNHMRQLFGRCDELGSLL